ncbi:BTB/POZ domain-containing protein 2 [Operophtera brumata]|uniref:BTB/POZ domain-containing protein 2 n=1 Tax=Operophtera brumata TaxID=104452 RepID=A0A0L7LNK1_OPEBR|nr:BTB/POZ domain-containing protein 2 [Operophtera brumata]
MASGSKNDIVQRLLNLRMEEGGSHAGAGDQQPPQNMLPSNQIARLAQRERQANEDESQANEPIASSSGIENLQPCNTGGRLHNWQATKTTVKERLSFLFNNEILCDVHFIVGKDANQQVIPAHKFVLSVGSAVFDAMFNGVLATKSDEIELPDVEPAAFLHLLKFLYSDEVRIGPESVMTTLYTAKKYAVAALEEHCVDFLKSNLGTDNAFLLLTQARLFDEPQLAALCLEMIDKNTADALNAEGFTDIDQDTLNAVLERDTLRIREAKIFGAVLRWSEAECIRRQLPVTPTNQRMVLGRAFNAIRFPLMSVEEFAMGPAQSGLLDDREIVQLFLYFTVNPKPNVGFLDTPRCCMTGKELTVNRFPQTESRWGYSGTTDRIRFTVDQRIFVGTDSYYGTKGLRRVTVDCNNGEKVVFQFSYAAGNNNGTSVEDGQIPAIIFYI